MLKSLLQENTLAEEGAGGPERSSKTAVVLFPEKVLDEVLVLKPAEKRSTPIHKEKSQFCDLN